MILLLAALAAWPSQWYGLYSEMNWGGLEELLPELEETEELAAAAMTRYLSGYPGAMETALEAVERDSADHTGWTALALIGMSGDSLRTDSLFATAFQLADTVDPVLYEIHAYWLLEHGEPERAAESASAAVAADSLFSPGWITLSMAYMELEFYQQAVDITGISAELLPNNVPVLHRHGIALDAAGMATEAEEVYREVIDRAPGLLSAYVDLGLLLESGKRDGEALKVYRDLLRAAPDHSWAWGEMGSLLLDMGRRSMADSSFRTAVELDPSDPWALFMLGRLRSTSDPASAGEYLLRAVEIRPDYLDAWQELVFVYESLDDMAAAEAAIRKCIELEQDAWLYGELGWILETSGQDEEAAKAYEAGVELDPQYLYGWQRRGDLLIAAGDLSAAESWFRRALDSLEQDDPWLQHRLGRLLAADLHPDSALLLFEKALDQDTANPSILLDVARAKAETGQAEEALEDLQRCLTLPGCDSVACGAEELLIRLSLGQDISLLADSLLTLHSMLWLEGGWSAVESGFNTRAAEMANRAGSADDLHPGAMVSLAELYGELHMPERRRLHYIAASMADHVPADVAVDIANFFFREEMYDESIKLLAGIYAEEEWSEELTTALAEAYLFSDELDTAERYLLEILDRNPSSVYSICYLGLIAENRGEPALAAQRYLQALRLEPGYRYAEDRLLYISGEDYDPQRRRDMNREFEWDLWLDISSTGGNSDEQDLGGGGRLAYNYDASGSTVEIETTGRAEIKDGDDIRRTAWASLSAEHFLTRNLYGGASISWDRQPLTVRPWQVSSYIAAGWKSWPLDWVWIAPEAGAGLVSTRWSVDSDRTDDWTVYMSLNLWARGETDWLPSLWLSSKVYLPPSDPDQLVANAISELEFYLPGPLSLILGASFDYTRTPVVESWKELDSEVYLRLRL